MWIQRIPNSNSSVKVPLRCDEFSYNPTIPEKMWLESNNYEGKYQKIVEAENHQKMYFYHYYILPTLPCF